MGGLQMKKESATIRIVITKAEIERHAGFHEFKDFVRQKVLEAGGDPMKGTITEVWISNTGYWEWHWSPDGA